MFTGIVEFMGSVRSLRSTPAGVRMEIAPGGLPPGRSAPAPGDSVAVQGCCLTLAAGVGGWEFDVVPETLAKTTLGAWQAGKPVNLELAATLGTLLGGHLVQGHVDGVGLVERIERGQEHRLRVRPPRDLMQYVTPKGSIAIDGVSLTVAATDPAAGFFEVALIPTTLEKTTLGQAREGGSCNLECDVMAKTVVHWLRHYSPESGR